MNALNFFFLSLGCTFAFCLGFFHAQSQSSRLPSQAQPVAEYLTFEQIPCPSRDEMDSYIQQAHFKNITLPPRCDESSLGKTMRLFKLASLLKVKLPEDWAISHENMLNDSLTYITKSTPEITMSNDNPHAIASNFLKQVIHLGPALFTFPPLKALEILIHENRHSHPYEPGHVQCRTGDIAKTDYGCDEEYSKKILTGAYSAGVMWSSAHSLYGVNLGPQSRQALMNSALSLIATRFNKVPEGLAVPLDLIFVLDDSGRVFQVHPFTFEMKPVAIHVPENDKIVKIQYDVIENGFLAFTENGKILEISSHLEQKPYYENILPATTKFIDSNKVYTPSSEHTQTYFVEDTGTIYAKEFYLDSLITYFRTPPFLTKKIFAGLNNKMLFLSLEGKIYSLISARGRRLTPLLEATQHALWSDASGGATYDVLYAVNAIDGLVYYMNTSQDRSAFKIQPSDFTTPETLTKFQEGLNLKVALSEDGNLWAWNYLRSTEHPWKLPLASKVVDFAMGRRYAITSESTLSTFSISAWSVRCGLRTVFREPWTKTQLGLMKSGELAFEGISEKPCLSTTDYYRWLTPPIQVRGTSLGSSLNYFSQTYLELHKKNGESFKIMPYHLPIREF